MLFSSKIGAAAAAVTAAVTAVVTAKSGGGSGRRKEAAASMNKMRVSSVVEWFGKPAVLCVTFV